MPRSRTTAWYRARIPTPQRTPALGAVILIAEVVAFTTAAYLPPPHGLWCAAVLTALGVVSLVLRMPHPASLGIAGALVLAACMVPALGRLWPLPMFVGVALWGIVAFLVPSLRTRVTGWIRPGRLGAVEIALIIAFSVVSSVALVLWVHLIEPDLTDVTERIPAWHPALLALLGLAFACMNALGEEIIWRGIMQDALEAGLGPGIAAMIVQGLSFGLFHINGFPRGLVGVGLATFYGVMMGILRMRSRGLLAPWIAHVCADATIFAIMAFWLTGPGSTPTED